MVFLAAAGRAATRCDLIFISPDTGAQSYHRGIFHMSESRQGLTSAVVNSMTVESAEAKPLKLFRRDLFDVRFQLAVQTDLNFPDDGVEVSAKRGNDPSKEATVFAEAPSDLVTGIYEGGYKTWECSLDLVGCLEGQARLRARDRDPGDTNTWSDVRQKRVLELGCGTAIPSMYLLYHLFNLPKPLQDQPNKGENRVKTILHLQDYNASVLEHVSLPNLLLAWYMSEASASFRYSGCSQERAGNYDNENHLSITSALKSAFLHSLQEYKVDIRFFAGSWSDFFREALSESRQTQYDVVLTSETIYRKESLGELVDVLKMVCSGVRNQPCLCLVAAKLVYFGVGGGLEEFAREVEKKNGVVCGVMWEAPREQRSGVGRRIVRVAWQ